ncbi:MAG: hypothetical protein ACLRX9_03580 [Streptococcus salivarius]
MRHIRDCSYKMFSREYSCSLKRKNCNVGK